MKRSRLGRTAALTRSGRSRRNTQLRPKPKPSLPRPLRDLERRLQERWAAHARGRRCSVCNDPGCGVTRGHHAIEKQALRRICATAGLDHEATIRVIWDLRNDMPVGDRCHNNHHAGTRHIPRAAVLAACPKLPQLLAELNAGWILGRVYPEPRQ